MRRWYSNRFYFPPSRPIEVEGGIKAQTKGDFGKSWWARRWNAVLESFQIGARLGRGRAYARQGQVLSIKIEPGRVQAEVQGSRSQPYKVRISLPPLALKDWGKFIGYVSRQALIPAKLLGGEMPEDIEKVFEQVGLSLFPRQHKDLKTDCSCPDWSNPCKHIAAVYYLLGEEFDRDPFLIFKLRGMSRKEFLKQMGGAPEEDTVPKTRGRSKKIKAAAEETPGEPLPVDPKRFWEGEFLSDLLFGEVKVPPVNAALPKRLGNFPFWRSREPFLSAMEGIYRTASEKGLEVFLGEPDKREES
ncbi:MAG: SWIM zinc finger family protein [Deltaproteobacteria bacterium]|nr:SWIM zinc finger family protein [Deltaproteobacteria bacterium]